MSIWLDEDEPRDPWPPLSEGTNRILMVVASLFAIGALIWSLQ
jgi:hypothetical protein